MENLDLLVPSVGNDAERFFMMTLVELSARATPIIGVGGAGPGSAWRSDDRDGLEAELVVLVHTVRGLVDSLAKADPNPYGPTYVDPVVWGVTVAPFAVSINPEAPSPGGTAAPLFQVLDAFLGRRAYDSLLGKEVQRLHDVAPPLQRAFVDAVAEMPLGAFLARVRHADPARPGPGAHGGVRGRAGPAPGAPHQGLRLPRGGVQGRPSRSR